MSRRQRAAVAAKTMKLLEDGGYIAPSGRRVDLRANVEAAVARTRLYLPDELSLWTAEPARLQTSIQVTGESMLAATRRLAATTDGEVGALNFASAHHPGGGFLRGAAAQEESLARALGLYACLQVAPDFYRYHHANRDPLDSDRVVYSTGSTDPEGLRPHLRVGAQTGRQRGRLTRLTGATTFAAR
jgi:uncharacterized protein (TIGR02452 family)